MIYLNERFINQDVVGTICETVCLTILMFMNLLEILVPLVKNNKKNQNYIHTLLITEKIIKCSKS